MFIHDVDRKPRSNKHLMPRRNWCSIREYYLGKLLGYPSVVIDSDNNTRNSRFNTSINGAFFRTADARGSSTTAKSPPTDPFPHK